ncbi:DUF2000 domain-containing protein [Streptomyces marincola]|uniref:DUF2000 domain-containing protein n=1 Tax=Streptomyces marincola TaxID=2878388 RepID=UPI001CF41B42|nr:DUF2000 domain-containing protein [Streptomyces marincola]UCM89461.1 DUF2000 domain-containing protein [Streptomyces marincola]
MSNPAPHKVAIVVDAALPAGLAANAASVLALSLGRQVESLIGPDLKDADGSAHVGITTVPLPILTADADTVKAIRNRAVREHDDVLTVDFTDCAQRTRTYEDYAGLLGAATDADLAYLGVALYGPRKQVQKLTGSLPLLR